MTDRDDEVVDNEETLEAIPPKRFRFPPVEYNNKTYDSIVLREPTAGQLMEARKRTDPIAQGITLIRLVAGVPEQVVTQLPQRLLEKAGDYFNPFSEPSPETGEG